MSNFPKKKIPALQPKVAEHNISCLMKRITSAEFKSSISKLLPPNVTPDRFVATMIAGINSSEARLKFAQCDFLTLFTASQKAANEGLMLDGEEASLVPFSNSKKGKYDIVYMRTAKGLVQLAESSDKVDKVEAHVLYQKDMEEGRFVYRPGVDRAPIFAPKWLTDRGEPVGAYSSVFLKNGTVLTRILDKKKIMSIANRSRQNKESYQPTDPDFEEWWNKAAIKAALKYAPRKMKVQQAIRDENAREFEDNIEGSLAEDPQQLTAPTVGGEISFRGSPPEDIPELPIPQAEPEIVEQAPQQESWPKYDSMQGAFFDSVGQYFVHGQHVMNMDTLTPQVDYEGRFILANASKPVEKPEAQPIENDPTQGRSPAFSHLYKLIEMAETTDQITIINNSEKWAKLDQAADEHKFLRMIADEKQKKITAQQQGNDNEHENQTNPA